MTTFQDRIRSTLTPSRDPIAYQKLAAPFDEVLAEFLETLVSERPGLSARVEKGQFPPVRTLLIWPRTRRDRRTILLSFWWRGTKMRSLAENERPPFSTPDELRDYLINFLEDPTLLEHIAACEQECKEDVSAYLRAHGFTEMTREDVGVRVGASEQRKLADARPGTRVSLTVVPEHIPITAGPRGVATYPYLSSGGFGLRDVTHRWADGRIHISGVVMAEGETA